MNEVDTPRAWSSETSDGSEDLILAAMDVRVASMVPDGEVLDQRFGPSPGFPQSSRERCQVFS